MRYYSHDLDAILQLRTVGQLVPKSFLDRRHESPEYEIEAWITGVRLPDGKVHWNVQVEGEDDPVIAADIFEKAAEVLRDE